MTQTTLPRRIPLAQRFEYARLLLESNLTDDVIAFLEGPFSVNQLRAKRNQAQDIVETRKHLEECLRFYVTSAPKGRDNTDPISL